jgi:hypothetical protein
MESVHAAVTDADGVGHAVHDQNRRREGAAMKKNRKPPPGPTGRGHQTECDRAKDHTSANTVPATREQLQHRETTRASFWPGREPFAASNLQKILGDDVLKGQNMPNDLNALAWSLNDIHGAFWFRKTTAPETQFKQATAERVAEAIQVLMCFFDQRRQGWRAAPAGVVDRERQLYSLFRDFVHGMTAHEFRLEMDTDHAALMPPLESWRHVAEAVAGAFRIAMFPQEFGRSNKGPVPRFVAAVMPLMTGESPTVSAVAQHLKRVARGKSSQQGQHET